MTEPMLDAERVAALLDGRLSADERAVVLAQLAADPDWREIAIDAGAIRDDRAAPEIKHAALRLDPRADNGEAELQIVARRRPVGIARWGPWLVFAAAASVAITVMYPRDNAGENASSVRAVAPVQALSLALSENDMLALTQQRWTVVRAGTSDVDETARAVRLGALSVDAMLARTARGAEARAEITDLLSPLNGAAASRLVDAAGDSASFVAAFDAVRALVARDAYDIGVWLELLRAGSQSAQAASSMSELLQRVVQNKKLSPERAEELTQHVRRLEIELPGAEPTRLRTLATEVMKVLAS